MTFLTAHLRGIRISFLGFHQAWLGSLLKGRFVQGRPCISPYRRLHPLIFNRIYTRMLTNNNTRDKYISFAHAQYLLVCIVCITTLLANSMSDSDILCTKYRAQSIVHKVLCTKYFAQKMGICGHHTSTGIG